MLVELDIENIALIERLNLEIGRGMTVLTGETGAGKSIIIDAVNLLLGGRTQKSLVRYGSQKARVQGLFEVTEKIALALSDLGIDAEENQVIVSREISAEGKSICRINGAMTPLALLKEAGEYLLNIHGQQDNQALLNPARHIDFLDEYAKADLFEYTEIYRKRQEVLDAIARLTQNEEERLKRVDLLTYQTEEIAAAKLKIGEKDELSEQKNIIENAEKIAVSVNEAYTCLYEENSAYDAISKAAAALDKISGIDAKIDDIHSKISDVLYTIEDSVHELKGYGDNIEFDENVLNDIEERLDLINKLERKYGGSEEAVLSYLEKASAELSEISNADETTAKLQKELAELDKSIKKAGDKITKTRTLAADSLQKEIEKALSELDMPKVRFKAEITPLLDYSQKGLDSVEFLICPNVGEQLKPLVQIASGGELSRVMLALKSILADSVDTMIFDEIDTGVSGSAAQKIAKKLSGLAEGKQVICVSHQPQLAAIADNHYKIEKHTEKERTVTEVHLLDKEERISELARIIDGDNITKTAIAHAKEMLGI